MGQFGDYARPFYLVDQKLPDASIRVPQLWSPPVVIAITPRRTQQPPTAAGRGAASSHHDGRTRDACDKDAARQPASLMMPGGGAQANATRAPPARTTDAAARERTRMQEGAARLGRGGSQVADDVPQQAPEQDAREVPTHRERVHQQAAAATSSSTFNTVNNGWLVINSTLGATSQGQTGGRTSMTTTLRVPPTAHGAAPSSSLTPVMSDLSMGRLCAISLHGAKCDMLHVGEHDDDAGGGRRRERATDDAAAQAIPPVPTSRPAWGSQGARPHIPVDPSLARVDKFLVADLLAQRPNNEWLLYADVCKLVSQKTNHPFADLKEKLKHTLRKAANLGLVDTRTIEQSGGHKWYRARRAPSL